MEEEMNALSESAGLFEVNFPDYKQLRACRKEVFLLKQLWDMIEVVLSSIEEWKDTLWSDINVENMEMECKRFVKEIRGLDKEMRAWDAFSGLDSTVKNMVTSLRAVGELQNPAIRDRHWQQLMQATKVSAAHFSPSQSEALFPTSLSGQLECHRLKRGTDVENALINYYCYYYYFLLRDRIYP